MEDGLGQGRGSKMMLGTGGGANRRRSSMWTTSMRRLSLAPSKLKTTEEIQPAVRYILWPIRCTPK